MAASSASLLLEVATPSRLLIKEQVAEVRVPGANGEMGIFPAHAPLFSELGTGILIYVVEGGARKFLAVNGGYVEVLPDRVRVLASQAEFADEIDVKRATEALRRANERLLQPTPQVDTARALNAMRRAQARLDAAEMLGPIARKQF